MSKANHTVDTQMSCMNIEHRLNRGILKYSCATEKRYRYSIPAISRKSTDQMHVFYLLKCLRSPDKTLHSATNVLFLFLSSLHFRKNLKCLWWSDYAKWNLSRGGALWQTQCTLVCTLQTRLLGCPRLVRATSGPGHCSLSPEAHYGELPREHRQQKHEEVILDDTVKR